MTTIAPAGPSHTHRMSSPENPGVSFVLKAGELRRLRTEWSDASTIVRLEWKNAKDVEFDNLAYVHP